MSIISAVFFAFNTSIGANYYHLDYVIFTWHEYDYVENVDLLVALSSHTLTWTELWPTDDAK